MFPSEGTFVECYATLYVCNLFYFWIESQTYGFGVFFTLAYDNKNYVVSF
jgi:hypothetical protein